MVSVYSCRLNLPSPSVHWSGESAVASLVAGQGYVASPLWLHKRDVSSAQSCWKSRVVLHLYSTCPPCPEPGLTWMLQPIHTGGPKEAQEHLGSPCLARSCWTQQHSLCSAGYACTVIAGPGGSSEQPTGFAHQWRQRLRSRGGEGPVCISNFMTCIVSGWIAFVQL